MLVKEIIDLFDNKDTISFYECKSFDDDDIYYGAASYQYDISVKNIKRTHNYYESLILRLTYQPTLNLVHIYVLGDDNEN